MSSWAPESHLPANCPETELPGWTIPVETPDFDKPEWWYFFEHLTLFYFHQCYSCWTPESHLPVKWPETELPWWTIPVGTPDFDKPEW